MTKREMQDIARKEFVEKFFDQPSIVSNFHNRFLLIRTDNPNFPYAYITVSAWTERDAFPTEE